jgi:peptidoglycan/LPS O-acetylase OafA/YrhL
MAHPIFSDKYYKWWLILTAISTLSLYILGMPIMYSKEDHGYLFWTLGLLFCGLVFGSVLYLLYRLFSGKWDNKAFIICITIMLLIIILTIQR